MAASSEGILTLPFNAQDMPALQTTVYYFEQVGDNNGNDNDVIYHNNWWDNIHLIKKNINFDFCNF